VHGFNLFPTPLGARASQRARDFVAEALA